MCGDGAGRSCYGCSWYQRENNLRARLFKTTGHWALGRRRRRREKLNEIRFAGQNLKPKRRGDKKSEGEWGEEEEKIGRRVVWKENENKRKKEKEREKADSSYEERGWVPWVGWGGGTGSWGHGSLPKWTWDKSEARPADNNKKILDTSTTYTFQMFDYYIRHKINWTFPFFIFSKYFIGSIVQPVTDVPTAYSWNKVGEGGSPTTSGHILKIKFF